MAWRSSLARVHNHEPGQGLALAAWRSSLARVRASMGPGSGKRLVASPREPKVTHMKRKQTSAKKRARRTRQKKFMTIFIDGKQKRVQGMEDHGCVDSQGARPRHPGGTGSRLAQRSPGQCPAVDRGDDDSQLVQPTADLFRRPIDAADNAAAGLCHASVDAAISAVFHRPHSSELVPYSDRKARGNGASADRPGFRRRRFVSLDGSAGR